MKLFNKDTLVANITDGPIRGGAFGDDKPESPAVYAWIKVPYAAPPLGEQMFKASRDPVPWTAVRDCSLYDITKRDYPTQWDWGQGYFSGKHQVIGTHDCLYLNIWRPQSREPNLPVQMNIHGGSSCNFSALGSKEWEKYVNNANCVIVSPGYRLGPWGNFVHRALKTGDPIDDSGNYAILDQIKVLRWIQDNIESFGGDPGNVTISGQSSGGLHAVMLLHAPIAKDLFHKVLISSAGLYPQLISATIEDGYRSADQLLINFLLYDDNGIDSEDAAAVAAEQMNQEEVKRYLLEVFTVKPHLVFSAYNFGEPGRPSNSKLYHWGFCDGCVVGQKLDWDYVSGSYTPKPMIIGATEADMGASETARNDSGGKELNRYAYELINGGAAIYSGFDEAVEALVPLKEKVPGGWRNNSVDDFKDKYTIAADACSRGYDIIGVHEPARRAAAAPGMAWKVFVYRQDWGSYSDASTRGAVPPKFEGFFQFAVSAEHSSDLWVMYDWNDMEGPGWFIEWPKRIIFTEENEVGRKDLANQVSAYLRSFLHSSDGVIRKTADMKISWMPWTVESEKFITWNATAHKAVLKMEQRAFTAGSLRAWLYKRIGNLQEANDEDSAALKNWIETQLSVFGLN